MASGVTVDPSCLEAYQKFKLKSPKDLKSTKDRPEEHKYILFTLSKDNTQIIVDKTVPEEKSDETDEFIAERGFYEKFVEDLPDNECRWAVYDFVYEKEGGKRKKIVFFSWVPDEAKTKQKMLFASSSEALKKSLIGCGIFMQASEKADITYEAVLEKAPR